MVENNCICINGYVESNNKCVLCHEKCLTCFDIYDNNCI